MRFLLLLLLFSLIFQVSAEKRILFDEAHGTYYTMEKNPDLIEFLSEKYVMDALSSPPLSSEKLQGYDILVVPDPAEDYSPSEVQAISDFVSAGGSLLIMCEADYKDYGDPDILNEILEGIDSSIRFNDDEFMDDTNNLNGRSYYPEIHTFSEHPITQNLSGFILRSGSSITILENAVAVASGDSDSYSEDADGMGDAPYIKGEEMVAIAIERIGEGVVVAIGSDSLFSDREGGFASSQNKQLAVNLFAFLAGEKAEVMRVSFLDRMKKIPPELQLGVPVFIVFVLLAFYLKKKGARPGE
ncbi:MAG: Gldg family protein [Candidatus Methanofastidiosia archaeon]